MRVRQRIWGKHVFAYLLASMQIPASSEPWYVKRNANLKIKLQMVASSNLQQITVLEHNKAPSSHNQTLPLAACKLMPHYQSHYDSSVDNTNLPAPFHCSSN